MKNPVQIARARIGLAAIMLLLTSLTGHTQSIGRPADVQAALQLSVDGVSVIWPLVTIRTDGQVQPIASDIDTSPGAARPCSNRPPGNNQESHVLCRLPVARVASLLAPDGLSNHWYDHTSQRWKAGGGIVWYYDGTSEAVGRVIGRSSRAATLAIASAPNTVYQAGRPRPIHRMSAFPGVRAAVVGWFKDDKETCADAIAFLSRDDNIRGTVVEYSLPSGRLQRLVAGSKRAFKGTVKGQNCRSTPGGLQLDLWRLVDNNNVVRLTSMGFWNGFVATDCDSQCPGGFTYDVVEAHGRILLIGRGGGSTWEGFSVDTFNGHTVENVTRIYMSGS